MRSHVFISPSHSLILKPVASNDGPSTIQYFGFAIINDTFFMMFKRSSGRKH